uniref:Lipocalin/cytosolic fatty-acid binding domain-containing protein n=1 Tax=Marmota marmota marmota TaxID=9994 RepID=A0A8C5ZHQ8_MARMA
MRSEIRWVCTLHPSGATLPLPTAATRHPGRRLPRTTRVRTGPCCLQVEGPWHTVKLGATDPSVIEEGGSYLCSMSGIKLLEDGDLNITYFHRKDGKCVQEFYIGKKTNTPGRYTFEYEGKNFLTFVAVGDGFLIMDLENRREAGALIVVELHGRTFLVNEVGQEAYRKHTLRRGIQPDNIVELSAHGKPPRQVPLLTGTGTRWPG